MFILNMYKNSIIIIIIIMIIIIIIIIYIIIITIIIILTERNPVTLLTLMILPERKKRFGESIYVHYTGKSWRACTCPLRARYMPVQNMPVTCIWCTAI